MYCKIIIHKVLNCINPPQESLIPTPCVNFIINTIKLFSIQNKMLTLLDFELLKFNAFYINDSFALILNRLTQKSWKNQQLNRWYDTVI